MKVLITGASGFIGSHLAQLLLSKGLTVIAIYQSHLLRVKHPQLIAVQKNLKQEGIQAELDSYKPDCLIHAAAINPAVSVPQSQIDFHQFNHQVSMRLVEEFLSYAEGNQSSGVKKLINLSTYEIYGQCESLDGHGMSAALNPLTEYARSKAETHQVIEAINGSNALLINAVCSNNYGAWQSQEKLIPAVVDNIINNQPINLYGDGSSTRTWTHVQDTCEGLLRVVLNGAQRKYHLCSEFDASVETIVDKLQHLMLLKNVIDQKQVISFQETKFNPTFKMNNQETVNDLKWRATIDLDTGLSATLDHLLGVHEK